MFSQIVIDTPNKSLQSTPISSSSKAHQIRRIRSSTKSSTLSYRPFVISCRSTSTWQITIPSGKWILMQGEPKEDRSNRCEWWRRLLLTPTKVANKRSTLCDSGNKILWCGAPKVEKRKMSRPEIVVMVRGSWYSLEQRFNVYVWFSKVRHEEGSCGPTKKSVCGVKRRKSCALLLVRDGWQDHRVRRRAAAGRYRISAQPKEISTINQNQFSRGNLLLWRRAVVLLLRSFSFVSTLERLHSLYQRLPNSKPT